MHSDHLGPFLLRPVLMGLVLIDDGHGVPLRLERLLLQEPLHGFVEGTAHAHFVQHFADAVGSTHVTAVEDYLGCLETVVFFKQFGERNLSRSYLNSIRPSRQKKVQAHCVFLQKADVEVVHSILKAKLRAVVRLEPLSQVAVPRVVVVKIHGDKGLHSAWQYLLVAQDLSKSRVVKLGSVDD